MAGAIESLLLRGLRATPKRDPDMAVGAAFPESKAIGKSNPQMLRNWAANSEFIRTANDIRMGQLAAAEWDIVPADPAKQVPKRLQQQLRKLFRTPNPRDEGWEPFIKMVVEDVLNLDAGSIEKIRSPRGEIKELWPIDGARVKVNRFWDGDPLEPRYYWMAPNLIEELARYSNNELTYIMQRPGTHRAVGLSNLEVLKRSIEAELWGHDYNSRQVTTAAGDGIFDLGETARPEQVDKFQRYFLAEVAGRGATAFWGGTKGAKWIPFRNNQRDMQFMEWLEYLAKKIAGVYQLFPSDLGFGESVNKATAQVQDQQGEDRGARPLMKLVAGHLTREVVWDPFWGGQDNNLAFTFTRLNLKETLQHAQIEEIQVGKVATEAVNEIRMSKGLKPLEGDHFNWPMAQSSVGFVSLRDVPTAREVMDSKTPKPPAGGGPESTPPTDEGEDEDVREAGADRSSEVDDR
ncbi:MAG TPA: phage portal protein [Solirubrobacterales bacterium]|nr:phage portal protein [Solirubrobacterales bacterium]